MKILIWDIETSPIIAPVWGLWQQDIYHDNILVDWYIICASFKWLGDMDVGWVSLLDSPKRFRKNHRDDYLIVKTLHKILSEADVLVAHNGDKFDLKKFNARAIIHGFPPLAPPVTVDTLKVARQHFKFDSNRLDYLGEFLGFGKKMNTPKGLWLRAIRAEELKYSKIKKVDKERMIAEQVEAIETMVEYCNRDVELLEDVYIKLRPYMTNHPNVNILTEKDNCPTCGSSEIIRRGFRFTRTGAKQRFRCSDCGTWSASGKNVLKANIR
jgi:predicted RNA-binding Zn-ribbon protein involved in translation (DUF1610 family)